MKRKIILCAVFLLGCSYGERADWDSGGDAKRVYQEQRQEEVTDGVNNRLPTFDGPQTEVPQSF